MYDPRRVTQDIDVEQRRIAEDYPHSDSVRLELKRSTLYRISSSLQRLSVRYHEASETLS